MINSESLAEKYRPHVLSELVGQQHIVTQIKGMIRSNRIPPTIMLYGPTGLGKTTVARMLARFLNCDDFDKKSLSPCGECNSCKYEEHPDVIEMNMADSRGIDDVRSMIQQAKQMPMVGNYKTFILDEFHMATHQAQQCLLKPTEEPPKHTLWLIATMSPDKVNPAIAGRCFKLEVKPIEPSEMMQKLNRIAKKEGVDFVNDFDDGKNILKAIADFSGGGMREAIQLLDGVLLAYAGDKNIDTKTVLNKFLAGTEADLENAAVDTLISVLQRDIKSFVLTIRKVTNCRGVLYKLRFLLECLLDSVAGVAKFTPYSVKKYSAQAKENGIKFDLILALRLQNLLLDIEFKMNSLNVDERTVFSSMVGEFIAVMK